MLPTEVQRILLLIGLAATAYLMILAWNDDQKATQTAPSYDAAPAAQQADEGFSEASVADAGDADVPDASLLAPAPETDASVAPGETPAMSASRLIHVRSASQEVWIDRQGGDVVRVQLPQHPLDLDRPDIAYLLLDNGARQTYIAQSGLMGPNGVDKGNVRPMYQTEADAYTVPQGGELTVTLTAVVDGAQVSKAFTFRDDDYLIDVQYTLTNPSPEARQAGLFAQIKRDDGDPFGGKAFSMGPQSYVGAAMTTPEERYLKLEFDDVADASVRESVQGGWIAFLEHYFLSAWIANEDETNLYFARKRNDGKFVFGYTAPLKTIPAGGQQQWHARFYAGPKNQQHLETIAPNLNLTVDYGFLWWIAVPLFSLLAWLHGLVGNWGAAIILLTVIVKVVLYPLFSKSYRSMSNMRRVAPQMKRLQERYADDRQKLSAEMMALYKKEGVNPLGGCLPMLLPMPIFIALYWVLWESVELRQAPFALWIQDLSVMDPYFILPLLMGGTMYIQQTLSPAVGDPMQVRMMKMMPIMFTVLFLFFPAGLVLYWLVNSVLSVAQQWWVMRQADAEATAGS